LEMVCVAEETVTGRHSGMGCGISWDLGSIYLGQSSHRAAFIHTPRDL